VATNDPQPLTPDEVTALQAQATAPAPQNVKELQATPVMLSAADLKELLSLKDQIDTLRKQLADQGKIASAIGETLCLCKGCHPDNVVAPGAPGYVEVKHPETGELLPYMAAGTHAA
jgi:hypothetical protein